MGDWLGVGRRVNGYQVFSEFVPELLQHFLRRAQSGSVYMYSSGSKLIFKMPPNRSYEGGGFRAVFVGRPPRKRGCGLLAIKPSGYVFPDIYNHIEILSGVMYVMIVENVICYCIQLPILLGLYLLRVESD